MFESPIDLLIEQIKELQSKGGKVFPAGIFPAYRHNIYWGYRRADCNIFYTATIVFTLNQIRANVSEKSQKNIDLILVNAQRNYPNYQNKDGLLTYNFYPTKPSQHFNNGFIFRHLNHFKLPDDADDTALVWLTSTHSSEEVQWLKEKLKQHANFSKTAAGETKQIKNTFGHYQNLKVYSTWFGKDMPIEFDACVLCNIMYFIYKNNLPLNAHDKDTLQMLRSVILTNEFLDNPFKAAHNYATTPIIIYHYARLMADFDISPLEACRNKLIETAKILLEKETKLLSKIILGTSIMKLSKEKINLPIFDIKTLKEEKYNFFMAGLLSAYEHPMIHFWADKKISQIAWNCPAHHLVLALENLVLQSRLK